MQLIRLNNQPRNLFKPDNLVFFAGTPDTTNLKKTPRFLTDEQKRHCDELESSGTPNAKEVAENFRKGRIDEATFREVREVLKDPNKMQKDPYKHFIKALAKGKFPDRAKSAARFLRAIEGSEKEQQYAKEFLRDLSEDSTGNLTARSEKGHLKKLTELRQQDLAIPITAAADISHKVEHATETPDKRSLIEEAPKALIEQLDRLEGAQAEIAKKSNAKEEELENEQKKPNPDKAKVAQLETEIHDLDLEFDKLDLELTAPRQEFQDYLTRNLSRFRSLEKFLKRSGIDLTTADKIKMWFLDLSADRKAGKPGTALKMIGVFVDPVTGEAKKQECEIQITGIRFEKENIDKKADAAGELMIEYVNEQGEKTEANYKNFIEMVDAFEAYEEIDSLEKLNKKIEIENGDSELKEGQEFQAQVLVGFDKEGSKIHENHGFKIEAIDPKKGTINLSRNVTKIPREWLNFSIDRSLYFDRNQQVFSYGEFAKFLKQHGYERKADIEEGEELCKKAAESLGADSGIKLTPPKAGESNEVLFFDENQKLRWGKISRDEKADSYRLEALPFRVQGEDEDIQPLMAAGMPMRFAAGDRAKTAWRRKDRPQSEQLTPMQLHRMIRAGNIIDAPAIRPAQNGRWELVKDPNQRAAATMSNKYSVGDPTKTDSDDAELDAAPVISSANSNGTQVQQMPRREQPAEKTDEQKNENQITKPKKKGYEEALPYNDIHKVGGMATKEESFLRTLWNDTRFLSVSDFWEMGKAMWDYYDRRFQRRQKDRYSSIGQQLPFFAPEMRRINQATETEQMNQFKESFEQKGVFEIEERLKNTSTRDEMKACFVTLSDKGQLRWDDIDMWQNLNKFVKADLAIPIPGNGDPYTRVSETDNRTGFDYLKPAIDSLFGEGQYNDWYQKNKSTFQSNARSYYEEGKELEGVQGGHALRLQVLLQQHKNGTYVNPHEFEGLLLHSIEAGKASMQAKIYFMMEGVAAVNKEGRTILPFDRMAHINSEMLIRFPILEYLCASVPRPPDGKSYRWTLDDYKEWVKWFDDGDPTNPDKCKPSKGVEKFMWEYVIPSDETQNRINKAIRNGENLDHDDMFAYLPPATVEVITDACKATTGAKKFLTLEGYANVFPGFSQYMKSLAAKDKKSKLREAIKSYVRFEGIMTNRYEKEIRGYQRMSYSTLNTGTIVSDTPPQAFINEMNSAIQAVVAAYNDDELNEIARTMYGPDVEDVNSEQGRRAQNEKNIAFDKFNDVLNRVVKSDDGEKMVQVMGGAQMEGMPSKLLSDAERAARKAHYTDAMALGN